MQLMVIKADGSQEQYLHTKVIATFVNAFVEPSEKNTFLASQLAESVTFYLYNNHGSDTVTSGEIFAIIKAVLSSTGFDSAAGVISEHHCRRNLQRSRVRVVKKTGVLPPSIAENSSPWNKSKITSDLIAGHNLDSATARTIASLVEEKILNSGFNLVPTDFIKFLMLWLMQTFTNEESKTTALHSSDRFTEINCNNAVTDDRLRQQQNGLCPVEA